MDAFSVGYLNQLFALHSEKQLHGKWIHLKHISPLLPRLEKMFSVVSIGQSEDNNPIYSIKLGNGPKKVLIWSQMHGNESTGTKAMFDLLNCFADSKDRIPTEILEKCTITYVPIVNPDGALLYTRLNSKEIDLNRDAVERKAIESKVLRSVLEEFQPEFCFNLHDQRTIFGVEGTNNPASMSFLAPSEEETRKITQGRIATMNVIVAMNDLLQQLIPDHVGRYTDEYYPTATGDNFQKLGYNTVLIEAGHFPDDYQREKVRKFNFFALLKGLHHIAVSEDFSTYETYFLIPNNQKNFYDVIEKNSETGLEIAYQYKEVIVNGEFTSTLRKVKEGDLSSSLAHEYRNT